MSMEMFLHMLELNICRKAWPRTSSLNKTDKTERGKIGVLLGSRKVELFVQEFFQKQELLISANLVLERDGFGVFDCDIRNANDGELLVRGRLKFYETKTIDDMDAL